MLKSKNIVAAAIFLATLGWSHVASAKDADPIDVSHDSKVLVIADDTSNFYSTFNQGSKNNTFADKFIFSINNSYDFAAQLLAPNGKFGIDSFDLYKQIDNSQVAQGVLVPHEHGPNNNQIWSLSFSNLTSGAYFLQVGGSLTSNGGGTFDGSLKVSPVPEADTYTMLLAGLGLICFLSRRRRVNEKFK